MASRDVRARRRSEKQDEIRDQDKPSVYRRASMTHGSEASDRWLTALGLPSVSRWHAEITIEADSDTTFELNIYAEEWGFAFHRGSRGTWIRVTDIPFVHGCDDFKLLARTPDLLAINLLATDLEQEHGTSFRRADATIRTNIPDATEIVRQWLVQSPPYTTAKATIELCGNEMHPSIHCTKVRGHDGDHEYQDVSGRGQLRWK